MPMTMPADQPLLSVRNLVKDFGDGAGRSPLKAKTPVVHAVADVSFDLRRGEVLSLVGESGCGKSTTGRCILRLVEPTSGSVVFEGEEVTTKSEREMRAVRKDMQIVFQDPFSSLHPRRRIRDIVAEPLIIHGMPREKAHAAVPGLLERVSLPAARSRQVPARVLRRSTPAHRHRPRAVARTEAAHPRRTGVGARRQHPGGRASPARGAARRARPHLPVHRPRPVSRAAHLEPHRSDVSRQDRRARPSRGACSSTRRTRTPRRCCRRRRSPTPTWRSAGNGSCSPVTFPVRATRRAAVNSTPAVGEPRIAAARRPRRWWTTEAGTWPPATSHWRLRCCSASQRARQTQPLPAARLRHERRRPWLR